MAARGTQPQCFLGLCDTCQCLCCCVTGVLACHSLCWYVRAIELVLVCQRCLACHSLCWYVRAIELCHILCCYVRGVLACHSLWWFVRGTLEPRYNAPRYNAKSDTTLIFLIPNEFQKITVGLGRQEIHRFSPISYFNQNIQFS